VSATARGLAAEIAEREVSAREVVEALAAALRLEEALGGWRLAS
jgi:hypothetical protein